MEECQLQIVWSMDDFHTKSVLPTYGIDEDLVTVGCMDDNLNSRYVDHCLCFTSTKLLSWRHIKTKLVVCLLRKRVSASSVGVALTRAISRTKTTWTCIGKSSVYMASQYSHLHGTWRGCSGSQVVVQGCGCGHPRHWCTDDFMKAYIIIHTLVLQVVYTQRIT